MKSMKQKLKVVFQVLLVIVCTFSLFILPANASVHEGGSGSYSPTSINPSEAEFEAAEKNDKLYKNSIETINASISNYELDIYHYVAPREGYYAIYTTGSLDTVGAVYEKQNFLIWTQGYSLVGFSDNGCMIDNFSNCSMAVHMDKGEDYFICIRGYGSRLGNYKLIIEPNEDKYKTSCGSTWVCKDFDNSSSKLWTESKQYLNKEQALLCYLLASNKAANMIIDGVKFNYDSIKNLCKKSEDKAYNYVNLALNTIMCFTPPQVSLPYTIFTFIMDEFESGNMQGIDEIIAKKCIVELNAKLNGDQFNTTYSINSGLLIKTTFNTYNPLNPHYRYYYANNDTILTGEKYCYGLWQ